MIAAPAPRPSQAVPVPAGLDPRLADLIAALARQAAERQYHRQG